jgi:NAD+ kinase
VKKLGIIANCDKLRASEVLRAVADKAASSGLQIVADKTTARHMKFCKAMTQEKMFRVVDAVMALGGDGTMLRAVRGLAGQDKPVLGVNIGSLGFMTSVAEKDIGRAMDCLASNNFSVSVRAIIEAVVARKGKAVARYRALNDVVLARGQSSRIMTLDVAVDGDYVTSYACDGLIVSTPTGSTGHSLSAGGPIVAPESRTLVISVICPHTLSSRPLVVPDQSEISITATETDGNFLLSVDGQTGRVLKQGDRIKVKRSDKSVRFIHLPGYSYFSVLRQKLHWRGSSI